MAGQRGRKKGRGQAPAGDISSQYRGSLTEAAVQAFEVPVAETVGSAVAKTGELLADGGSALGSMARAGLRAAGSLRVDDAAGVVLNTAKDVVVTGANAAGPAIETVAGAAGEALSTAAGLAGPALEAAGDVAGDVLGAVAEGIGDALSG
jgi:hypothetical protein